MKSLLFVLLFSFSAQAFQEITCWENDCLKNGWTRLEPIQGSFTDFQCYQSGCKSSGWIVGGLQNIRFYTQCKTQGCFSQGWYEIDRDNQNLKAEVICNDGDCLTNGWTTYGSNRILTTQCAQNDCRSVGWTSQTVTGLS
ncbi:MAG: hypothetical protein ACXWC9_05380, partial [Pseudobdellovibrionaceae bacterium]